MRLFKQLLHPSQDLFFSVHQQVLYITHATTIVGAACIEQLNCNQTPRHYNKQNQLCKKMKCQLKPTAAEKSANKSINEKEENKHGRCLK